MEETVVVQRVVPAAPVLSAVSVPEVLSELEGGHAADHLKKKEKRRERHDRWMQKLGGIYQQARDEKNKKQPDVGSLNLTALHHVLPSAQAPSQDGVQSSSSPHSSGSGHSKKAHVAVSQSARRQAGVNEIIRLQKVIQHPTFKGNPLATIRQHLQNNLAKQNAAQ
ncbi:ribosome biogenesis protein SLX9-domain-containing protein [Fimicolochytrium jonesii]|uniref:ribosome biogenesis protein SLX9-domain-containing protein n=1 Tax=Fimicolochytrium jonesii TaxID=1396493 RepID=UPI0022FDD697|nr:ribosome biogenesis protein SLX9-domain-containing protein [Fimicolochytrium jonesii]KAI8822411.1 ribosome biogenesis protein SLX9-domain-containing protein [Fimicolochytrium jonesii]